MLNSRSVCSLRLRVLLLVYSDYSTTNISLAVTSWLCRLPRICCPLGSVDVMCWAAICCVEKKKKGYTELRLLNIRNGERMCRPVVMELMPEHWRGLQMQPVDSGSV